MVLSDVVVQERLRDEPDSWEGSMSSCKEDDDKDGEARDSVEGSTDMMMEVNWSQVYVTVSPPDLPTLGA